MSYVHHESPTTCAERAVCCVVGAGFAGQAAVWLYPVAAVLGVTAAILALVWLGYTVTWARRAWTGMRGRR